MVQVQTGQSNNGRQLQALALTVLSLSLSLVSLCFNYNLQRNLEQPVVVKIVSYVGEVANKFLLKMIYLRGKSGLSQRRAGSLMVTTND